MGSRQAGSRLWKGWNAMMVGSGGQGRRGGLLGEDRKVLRLKWK